MSKTRITVTQDELEALQRYQARKKKKEEAQAKLQKLKTTQWEVPSLEEAVVKSYLDYWDKEPGKEEIKEFVDEAQQLIDFGKTMISEEAMNKHDDIVKKFTKKGWRRQKNTEISDGYFGLYNYSTVQKPDIRVVSSYSGEYQFRYQYRVAQDRVIVMNGGHPQLVVKAAIKITMVRKGLWSATIRNNSIRYCFDGLDSSKLATLLGEKKEGDRPIAYALSNACWGSLIVKQDFDCVMTDKQISSYYKKWYLSRLKDGVSEAHRKIKNYEQTYKVISDADFTHILEACRKEE